MGATLPIVARWLGATPKGIAGTGLLYSANTAGAVCGCLLAGFYLLRVHDVVVATLVAAALDCVVAASAWFLSILEPHGEPSNDSQGLAKARHYAELHRGPGLYLAIGLSDVVRSAPR
jgi:spermidine synthase